jgi:hypothetical protein
MFKRKVRSRFGQPNRDGSEEEPERGRKQRLCKPKAAREQTGAVQGDTAGRRVKERSEQSLWRLCAAGIRRKRKRCRGRAFQSSLAGVRAAGSQPARPCDAARGEDDLCPMIGYSRFC